MRTYDLSRRGTTPLYEYLYNCIKNDILSGELSSGEKLPSKREMATNHNVSVVTVQNAYEQLLVEGYVRAEEKKGYYVEEVEHKASDEIVGNHKKRAVSNSSGVSAKKNESDRDSQKDIIDFSSNHIFKDNFPFNTWAKVMRRSIADNESDFLESPDHMGVERLREAISQHLLQYRGMEVNPDNIIIGAGMEYLYGLVVQLLGHSKMIAVEDPGHTKVTQIYESNGIKCLHIPVDEDGMEVDRLENSGASAVHISPSHQFPTGAVMPASRRHKLINWANETGSYIIEDDYDSELRFFGRPIPTIASIDPERVIYMNTFTKTLSPSIRIAYMILPDELMKEFRKNLSFYSSTVSTFEQYTLATFIEEGFYGRHINRMRNFYRKHRQAIIDSILASPTYKDIDIIENNSGLHFIVKVKNKIDDESFVKRLAQDGVKIKTVADYCYNRKEKYRHQFIINYSAVEIDDFDKALKKIEKEFKEAKEQTDMSTYNANPEIHIKIPKSVASIIRILEKEGFEAFAVGGCVRDAILNREPDDWDITTSALPEDVKRIFHRTFDTGLQHGTVTVRYKGKGYEITTYRIEGEYKDSRHPESVEFTSDLLEDLKRRDLTINAMAYNPQVGLVDAFGGMNDLEKKEIKCVGDARNRFQEDALRILRAIRFSAQLGFKIEAKTKTAMKELASTLANISAERIQVELEKTIMSKHPEELKTAYELGITKVVIPEFDAMMEQDQKTKYHEYSVGEHTIIVMQNVEPTKVLRWSALLHDIAKPVVAYTEEGKDHFIGHAKEGSEMARKIMRRLKMDNKTIRAVQVLVLHHDDRPTAKNKTPEAVRRSVHAIGKEYYDDYLKLVEADYAGKSDFAKEKSMESFEYEKEQYEIIKKNGIATTIGELEITGKDLINLGCKKGEKIGEILEALLDIVLTDPKMNEHDVLVTEAKKLM